MNAQYTSRNGCLDLCVALPDGTAGEDDSNSVACRQYWAGTPALTDPDRACLAAGPFGGNVCGDRCLAFCQLTLSACPTGPYATQPACAAACAEYTFRDAGVDGGGETPFGPVVGNTLNCRLYWLRQAIGDAGACSALGPDSGACQ